MEIKCFSWAEEKNREKGREHWKSRRDVLGQCVLEGVGAHGDWERETQDRREGKGWQ